MINKWKIYVGVLMLCVGFSVCTSVANAQTVDFPTKVTELKTKFPHGKYWNHVGMTTDNSDGYTDQPCLKHKTNGVDHVYGTNGCTCNHFAGGGHLSATQCMGFANKLGYDVFGNTTWTTISNPTDAQISQIKVGDIVRLSIGHSVFVITKEGNDITVGEANYPNRCIINWDRKVTLSTSNVTYYEHANNYDAVINNIPGNTPGTNPGTQPGDNPQVDEPTVVPFTGWKATDDNAHQCYFEKGVLQKSKWITEAKKKYYVDENGYRVSGLFTVKDVLYFFDTTGVMQKKTWISYAGKDYYVNEDGWVLKSQWLYKKNVLVYVKKNGAVAKNEIVKINKKQYLFNAKGKRSKGFKKLNGKYYYCDKKGIIQKNKWITKKGKTYYLQKDGVRATSQLLKIGSHKYYFDEHGYLVKNKKVTYKNKIYKANKKGYCKKIGKVTKSKDVTTE